MNIGERIFSVRKNELKWSQQKLANRVGVSRESVSQWESGGSKGLKQENLLSVAKALNVQAEWLVHGKGQKYKNEAISLGAVVGGDNFTRAANIHYREVPLISNVSAGNWEDIFDEHPVGYGEEPVPCTVKCSENTVAFKVNGDSMTSELGDTFPAGTLIFVDPQAEPKAGSYIIARLKSDTQATFKKLIIDGSRKYLQPLNKALPPLLEEFEVLGVVVEAKISYV